MMRRSCVVVMMLALSAAPAFAQPDRDQPPRAVPVPQKTPPGPPTVTPVAPTPPPPGQPAEAQPARRTRGRDVNLQIELTITDQTGTAAADKKVVSMLVADGTSGRIRSTNSVGATINVDSRPQILQSEQILVELTLEYAPPNREGVPTRERPAVLNESLSVILQNGKPQLVSQASDPANDRKMTLEVRVTTLK